MGYFLLGPYFLQSYVFSILSARPKIGYCGAAINWLHMDDQKHGVLWSAMVAQSVSAETVHLDYMVHSCSNRVLQSHLDHLVESCLDQGMQAGMSKAGMSSGEWDSARSLDAREGQPTVVVGEGQ